MGGCSSQTIKPVWPSRAECGNYLYLLGLISHSKVLDNVGYLSLDLDLDLNLGDGGDGE